MSLKLKFDLPLLITISILLVLGLVILTSASVVISQERLGNTYGYLKHQLIFGMVIGLISAWLVYKIPYQKWRKLSIPLLIISITTLILVLIPRFTYQFGGAKRWLNFGSFLFQPSELAKLAFIIYLSAILTRKNKLFYQFINVIILLIVISILLVLQPDISTLSIIVVSCLVIYFIAGAKISYVLILAAGYLAAFLFLVRLAPYRWHRLLVYFNPQIDVAGIGYQINQALLALGSGGIFGLGIGHSRQKYNYLPEPMGDSIFAIIGEELGFVGVLVVLGLFTFLFIRAFKVAKQADSDFGRFLAFGIGFWLFLQAFINMAAVCGLVPVAGIPLPFISYGGSSLVVSLVAIGILLNISKHRVRSPK